MTDRAKWNRRRFLHAEILTVICLISIWGLRSGHLRVDYLKAAVLQQVVKVTPADSNNYQYLGGFHLNTHDFEAAATAYKQLAAIEPNSIEAHIGLSNCYRALGRKAEAMAVLQRLTRIHPNYAFGFASLGSALMDMDKPAEAAAAYQRAVELEPSLANLHLQLGKAQVAMGNVMTAIESFQCAIQEDAQLGKAYFELALACIKTGQAEQAASAYQKLVELDEALAHDLRSLFPTG